MHTKFIAAFALAALLAGVAAAANYVQAEYAKNPDGDCVRTPAGFYEDKVRTAKGIEETIFLACQTKARGDYNTEKVKGGEKGAYLDKGLRCVRESLDANHALQKAGVVDYRCPTGRPQ